MEGNGHRLDTDAKGIPAADGTRVLVTAPWTSSRTKARRERASHQAMMDRAGLTADIVYMAKPVVPKANPRKRMTTNKVTITYQAPRVTSTHWTAEHDYTQG